MMSHTQNSPTPPHPPRMIQKRVAREQGALPAWHAVPPVLELFRIFLFVFVFVSLPPALAASPPEDAITLQTGEILSGHILGTRDGKLRIEQRIGQGRAELAFSPERIAAIQFASPFDPASLPHDPAHRLRLLESLWAERAPLASIEGSGAEAIACAIASCLLDSGHHADALGFLEKFTPRDESSRDRLDALRARALVASGALPEALALARDFERRSPDPAAIAPLALAAGELALAQTNADLAADHFLRNAILNPESPEAPEGLWRAAQLALSQTNFADARRWLGDIARDHTNSSFCARAHEAIAQLPEGEPTRATPDDKPIPKNP